MSFQGDAEGLNARFNFNRQNARNIEERIFSISSTIGQILFPTGFIMIIFLPVITAHDWNGDLTVPFLYMITPVLFILFGLGATASAMLDSNTVWHRLNRRLNLLGWK